MKRIEVAGVLHDIGKVGLPDAILQKPGPLGKHELAEIRTHPEIGAQILNSRGLEDLREWVLAHHERPDGKGYPAGLSDSEIPLEAKILAVADAYEAMISDRVYRPGIDERAARAELLRCSGDQFDSRVVAAFLTLLNRADEASSVRDVESPKRSVSVVIEGPEGLLLVRRPDDDEDLPGVWGLPAVSLGAGESEEDAVRRAGRDKLGVELEPVEPVGREGSMTDWEARILAGRPAVPQPGPHTQYVELRFGEVTELRPAARDGSLCCRALLRARGLDWGP